MMKGVTSDADGEWKDGERHAPQSSEVNTMEPAPAAAAAEDEAALENVARKFLSDVVDLIASAEGKLASPQVQGAAAEADAVRPEGKSSLVVDESSDPSAMEAAARPLQEEKSTSQRAVAEAAEAGAAIPEEKSPLVVDEDDDPSAMEVSSEVTACSLQEEKLVSPQVHGAAAEADAVIPEEKSPPDVDGNNNDPSAMEVSSEVTACPFQEEKLAPPQVHGAAADAAEADAVIPEEKSPLAVDGNNNDPSAMEVSSEVTACPLQEEKLAPPQICEVAAEAAEAAAVIPEEKSPLAVDGNNGAAAKNLQESVTSLDIESVDDKCDILTANTTQDLSSIQASASVVACEVSSKFSSSNGDAIGKKEETVGDVASSLPDEAVTECITPLDVPSSPKAIVSVKEETTSPQGSSTDSGERPSISEANLQSVKSEELYPECCLNVDAEVKEVSSEICQNLESDNTLQVRNPSSQSPKQEIGELRMEFQETSSYPDGQSNPIVPLESIDELVDNNKNAVNDSAKIEAAHKSVSNELFEGPIGYENPDNFDDSQYITPVVYGCSVCFTIVGCTRESFMRHQKEYHWISLQCKVCKRKFSTTKGYENHMTTHIRYPCLHCPKEFRHQLEVEDHQGQHFLNKLFRCDRCGEEFYLRATLTQHRSFMGEKCPEILSNVHKIQEQLSSTQNEELVKCRSGCKSMIPKSMMKAHIKDHADKIQEAHIESRTRAKRVRLESDV